MSKKEIDFLLPSLLGWRVLLFVFLFLAIFTLPLQNNFLGGGLSNYLKAPWLWSWLNFDGEHYLSIARQGYLPLTYFYFPAFPLMVRLVASLFGRSFLSLALSGLLVSHLSFFLALVGLWKLIRLDSKEGIARLAIAGLFLFPTSFYFGCFYTESLFLALIVWSFYFARKQKWFLAGILGAVSTATRVVGLALIPALLIEAWLQKGEKKKYNLILPFIGVTMISLGILAYMYYLQLETGDPLEFFHSVSIFGQQRSPNLILLPQVFYRYLFKILPNINYSYFPVVFSTWLEALTGLAFLAISIIGFFRLRLSYAVYLAIGYLVPTFSGSFSSLPRYVVVLFPAFILFANYLSKKSKVLQILNFAILFICLGIATSLFVRGYWIG
jgi:Gpi18-like mannosyltransferase